MSVDGGVLRTSRALNLAARPHTHNACPAPLTPSLPPQHTGDWTLQAYARSAPYPRGTVVAQDFFDMGERLLSFLCAASLMLLRAACCPGKVLAPSSPPPPIPPATPLHARAPPPRTPHHTHTLCRPYPRRH